MKINRLLTAALITFATVLTGCVKESVWDRETGIDSSKAAPEGFSFDANELEKPCVRDPRSPSAVDPRKQV